jgi:hypothetical protein
VGGVNPETTIIEGVEYELTPIGVVEQNGGQRPRPGLTLAELHERFERHLYLPDLVPVDVAAATVIANRGDGDPAWVQLRPPPSAGKTEIIQSVTDAPRSTSCPR